MGYKQMISKLLDELVEARGCAYVQILLESWGLDDYELLYWGFDKRTKEVEE